MQIKKRYPRTFIPLDKDIYNNAKFREASYLAKKDEIKIKQTDFIAVFLFYCTQASKIQKNIDIRTINTFLLLETGDWNVQDLEIINNYLVKVELLTKKYTIASWYKWNSIDCQGSQGSQGQEIESQDTSQGLDQGLDQGISQDMSRSIIKDKIYARKSYLKTRKKLDQEAIHKDLILIDLYFRLQDLDKIKIQDQGSQGQEIESQENQGIQNLDIKYPLKLEIRNIEIKKNIKENISSNEDTKEKINQEILKTEIVPKEKNLVTSKLEDQFNQFWDSYPKKEGKKKVKAKFESILIKDKTNLLFDKIMEGLNRYNQAKAGTDIQYIKQPLTWLNGAHWEDDLQALQSNQNINSLQPYERNNAIPGNFYKSSREYQIEQTTQFFRENKLATVSEDESRARREKIEAILGKKFCERKKAW